LAQNQILSAILQFKRVQSLKRTTTLITDYAKATLSYGLPLQTQKRNHQLANMPQKLTLMSLLKEIGIPNQLISTSSYDLHNIRATF
jgi:hypothetical protein